MMKTMNRIAFLALMTGIAGVGLASAAPASVSAPHAAGFPIPMPGGTIAGEVISGKGGAPVSNAPVRLTVGGELIATAVTDGNGNFTFGRVAPGRYEVGTSSSSRAVNISGHAVFVTLTAG